MVEIGHGGQPSYLAVIAWPHTHFDASTASIFSSTCFNFRLISLSHLNLLSLYLAVYLVASPSSRALSVKYICAQIRSPALCSQRFCIHTIFEQMRIKFHTACHTKYTKFNVRFNVVFAFHHSRELFDHFIVHMIFKYILHNFGQLKFSIDYASELIKYKIAECRDSQNYIVIPMEM